MATGKLTLKTIGALVKTDRTEFLWDEDLAGFGLRMTSNGAKSYIYQYRMGGREAQKKRFTIGKHGSPWTPETARTEAKRLAMMVGQGIDPASADKERRRIAVDLAFEPYANSFVDGYLKAHWKDWQQGKSLLDREAVPVLQRTPLPLIKRSDVSAVLDRLKDRPAVARLMHATLRKLFKWAVSRGDIERSPIESMDAPRGPASRDRVLTDAELATIWEASDKLGYPFAPMYRLLIVSGQRREEIAALDWCELDRDTATWTLPADRAKNGKVHIVPLNALAVAELDALATQGAPENGQPPKWPKRGLVFTTTGKTAVSGYSRGKTRLDREIALLLAQQAKEAGEKAHDMEPWRVHDFRRTVATGLQRLGVRFEVTEATLNHVSGARSGVAGVYQRHDWKEEKRTALDAWGRHVSAILDAPNDTNVTTIVRRAAA
ncbi:site-specific integrase [Sphingomonas populi]|uniref:Site-specific integrase n=1 Tax=Sphingomonas populi TaxID=2484750 RepID=A0A4Q6Y231_9SPHN|nr:site-specific integrase [Sphingomonas populi]RZF63106.1 site-specific integrase [Sphingomonas populi]